MRRQFLSIMFAPILSSLIPIYPVSAASMQPIASEAENSKAMTFYRAKRCAALLYGMGRMLEDADQKTSSELLTKSDLFFQFAQTTAISSGFKTSREAINDDIGAIAINYFEIWQENARLTGHNFDDLTTSDGEFCNSFGEKWG